MPATEITPFHKDVLITAWDITRSRDFATPTSIASRLRKQGYIIKSNSPRLEDALNILRIRGFLKQVGRTRYQVTDKEP